ncbi:3894_t:CDS:2, partial [Dentiscutata erythropus]
FASTSDQRFSMGLRFAPVDRGTIMLEYPIIVEKLVLKLRDSVTNKCPMIGCTCDAAVETDKRAKTLPRKISLHHNPFRLDCWNKAIVIKFFTWPPSYVLI